LTLPPPTPLCIEIGDVFALRPPQRALADRITFDRHSGLTDPTPHSAFYTPESFRDNRGFAARTAARFLRDGRLENCVNRQFLIRKV